MKKQFFSSVLVLLGCIVLMLLAINIEKINSHFFSTKLEAFATSKSKQVNHLSIYIYTLHTHEEFRFNDEQKYFPASLMKVICMISYYKLAEKDPAILKKKLMYEPEKLKPLRQNIKPKTNLQAGKEYTVDALIDQMIITSDNAASNLLFENLPLDALKNTFYAAQLAFPDFENVDYALSSSEYARFLITLEQKSYLNPEMSQRATALLKRSEFKDGIVAGLPKSVPVAHKFAERRMNKNQFIRQFHECGIVYKLSNPYVLCVMTDGRDIPQQAELVSEVSQFVYENI